MALWAASLKNSHLLRHSPSAPETLLCARSDTRWSIMPKKRADKPTFSDLARQRSLVLQIDTTEAGKGTVTGLGRGYLTA
jgi:hypothetical protein